jgi:hypothetical protein
LLDQTVKIQPELAGAAVLTRLYQQLGRSTGVSPDAVLLAFADLDPGRGQLDQCSQDVGGGSTAAAGVPDLFPHLVRFPIISGIEKLGTAL